MEKRDIDIEIDPDGTIRVDLVGYKGTACEDELKKIARVLGVSPQNVKKKAEYYNATNEERTYER